MEDHPESEAPAGAEPETEPTFSQESAPAEAPAPDQAEQPAGEQPEERAGSEPANVRNDDPLAQLAEEAARHRLAPPEEERATQLLQAALLDGREGVGKAIEILPRLPWLIGVNAVSAAWQEMKPTFRTRLLAGLGRLETESARRVRLSLARGLFKQDVPAALKIAVSVGKDLREKETGLVSGKNCHVFASVFIGRAKPWVAQLPLDELKPAEADVIVHVALMAAFGLPHPPATQLALLKWAASADRLAKLHPAVLEAIIKGLGRWNGKWRQALYTEVKELPPEIAALVAPPPRGERTARPEREAEGVEPGAPAGEEPAAERDEEDDDDDEADRPEAPEGAITAETRAPAQRPRPVYESKTIPSGNQQRQNEGREGREGRRGQQELPAGRGQFHLPDALRAIDSYVQGLRNELQTAQAKLRQREDDRRQRPAVSQRTAAPAIEGEPTPEELARLNVQLEARNAELQARLDELREDSEQRAASSEAESDPAAQLRALLGMKLKEDYEDFAALETEAPDVVVQQHYKVLLRHVFEVLKGEGVSLKEAPLATRSEVSAMSD